MMTAGGRTLVVTALVGVIAVRTSLSQPVTPQAARVGSDPEGAFARAADGWSDLGALGGASAQGLRDLPLAGWHWLCAPLDLSAEALQVTWRVLVLVLALWGAIRLARALSPGASWSPWVAAVLFSSGPVVVAAVLRSPTDGLAAAALPWVVGPLLVRGLGWRPAAAAAAWIGLAGFGSPGWAFAALLAGLVAGAVRARGRLLAAARFVVLAAAASAWWVAAYVWEHDRARDVSALVGEPGLGEALAQGVGRPGLAPVLLVAVAAGPLLAVAAALALRAQGTERGFVGGLAAASVVAVTAWAFVGDELPVLAPTGEDPTHAVLAPVLGWLSVAALVAWTPLIGHLTARLPRDRRPWPLPRRVLAELVVGAAIVLTATAGLAAAAAERPAGDDERAALAAEVAAWSRSAPPGRVLVLPATAQEPPEHSLAVALGARPWVGRGSLPTSGAAATAALDEVVTRLSRGDGGPGTQRALSRLGVGYVLVHLGDPDGSDAVASLALVRSALAEQDARPVAVLDAGGTSPEMLIDLGVRAPTERVEIWSVPEPASGFVYAGAPLDVVGDPGAVADLDDAGVLGARAVRLQDGSSGDPVVLSDSARRRDVDQRVAVDPYGPALAADEPRSLVPADASPATTAVRRVTGVRSVAASSTAAAVSGDLRQQGTDAYAAVDGNVFTAWQSRRGAGRGQWWEIDLEAPADLAGTAVQLVTNPFGGHVVTQLEVSTDHGSMDLAVPVNGLLTLDSLPRSAHLRIRVSEVAGTTTPRDSVGIAEVTIPGVRVRDQLVVVGPAPTTWVLGAERGSSAHCVPAVLSQPATQGLPTVCNGSISVAGPDVGAIERVLTVAEPTAVTGLAWARASHTADAAALADRLGRPTVVASGSSVVVADLVTRPQAAADGDASTAWRPAFDDPTPTLTLTWPESTKVLGLRLETPDDGAASVPTRVRVVAQRDDADPSTTGPPATEADVRGGGWVVIPPVRTRQLVITVLEDTGRISLDPLTSALRHVPIAVAEVDIIGGPAVRYDSSGVHDLPCGSGPEVELDGRSYQTRVSTSAADVVNGHMVRASLCRSVRLDAGEVEVRVPASYAWAPQGLLLAQEGGPFRPGGEEIEVLSDRPVPLVAPVLGAGEDSVLVDLEDVSTERTLAVAVPADSGWDAMTDEGALVPVTLDGWAQGWQVPPGVTRVELRYSSAETLRDWAGAGAIGWGLVLLLAVVGLLPSRGRSAAGGRS
ncbi:hypothetical protein NSZ01_06280 [Nocardioides szechwanensis]|uniref:Arabinofuranan 3-O-arabinosyltransferase n=1 Tax=Nocardioides szechwanensis TaxID=1005944 RepID=A0A1G9VQS6_9ACTN|nr:hypothetical protein NSZ01_06280 [Nocardioides szechwanensis]SDM74490.1 protein of unknown function [Nocardioides szechwanensis]